MKIATLKLSTTLLILMTLGCATTQQRQLKMTSLILEKDKEETDAGQFFVKAKFDGQEERCFLDTGATTTTVKATSFFAAYTAIRESKFMGISGKPAIASRIQVGDIQVGENHFQDQQIVRLPNEKGMLSTLGIDLFQNQRVGFELKDHRLILPMTEKTSYPFHVGQKGHIIVPVTLGNGSAQMIWDTGAGLTTIDQKFISDHAGSFQFIKNISVGDALVDGATVMKLYLVSDVVIGHLHMKNVKVLGADFTAIQEKLNDASIVGAVGFNVLASYNWYFDMKSKTYSVK